MRGSRCCLTLDHYTAFQRTIGTRPLYLTAATMLLFEDLRRTAQFWRVGLLVRCDAHNDSGTITVAAGVLPSFSNRIDRHSLVLYSKHSRFMKRVIRKKLTVMKVIIVSASFMTDRTEDQNWPRLDPTLPDPIDYSIWRYLGAVCVSKAQFQIWNFTCWLCIAIATISECLNVSTNNEHVETTARFLNLSRFQYELVLHAEVRILDAWAASSGIPKDFPLLQRAIFVQI